MIDYICKHIVKSVRVGLRGYQRDIPINHYGEGSSATDVLKSDPMFEKKLLAKALSDYPVLFFEEKALVYAVVSDGDDRKFVIGPVCIQSDLKDPLQKVRTLHGSQVMCSIPHTRLEFFCDEVLLLHNLLHKTELTYLQLLEKNMLDARMLQGIEQELFTVGFSYHENNELHNPYDQELREIECIKQGDIEKLGMVLDEVFPGKYGTLSKDSLRDSKNLAICGMMIASRAAIAGGILPEMSFTICDAYIVKIDEATTIGQPEALARQAKFYYAQLVAAYKQNNNKNPLVEKCKNMIYRHMHGKIQVKELADKLAVNSDYLSHVFYKVEKIKIHDFIEKEKVVRAVNMLMYSDYSMNEIGHYLGFSSQSHFGSVFKKWRGLSPKQFQNQFHSKDFITKK